MTTLHARTLAELESIPTGGVVARAAGLSKIYGTGDARVVALDNVTVELGRGRITAVMGPSGSGGSPADALHGGPRRGHVRHSGRRWCRQHWAEGASALTICGAPPRLRVPGLQPGADADALENITLPLDIAGGRLDAMHLDTVVDALGIRDRLTHRPSELSGGQQQRVACARALIRRPAVVFADEPTGNLDSRSSAEVLGFLRRPSTTRPDRGDGHP